MASFDLWIDGLLKDEGGYAPRDNDRGAVNRGITQQTLDWIHATRPDLVSALGLPLKVADLTVDQTKGIYRVLYWNANRLTEINDQKLANLLGHMGVNQGTVTAAKFLQQALRLDGTPVKVDGVIGQQTLTAANTLLVITEEALCVIVKYFALRRYVSLAVKNPGLYSDDLQGWAARLDSL